MQSTTEKHLGVLNFMRCPNGLRFTPKTQKMKFSEMGLPGVEKLNGPCGILLPLSRASQLPYSEKSENCRRPIILNIFPIYSLLIPLRAAYGAQTPAAWRTKFTTGDEQWKAAGSFSEEPDCYLS